MSANMTTPHLPGKFIWFEHASGDVAKARAFYEPLFGWHVETMPMGDQSYPMILNGGEGIGGLRSTAPGEATRWISYLSVPDVDASFAASKRNGAKPVSSPADFAPVGRGADLIDPTGAALSLWKSNNGDRPDVEKTPPGDWVWNELWTPDASSALVFYERTFGYDHDAKDMGEQGSYLILKGPDGKQRGGIFQCPDKSAPPLWLPYVHVADCDASADRARQLGANVFMPPTDIPGIGRFAVLFDPQGAAIAIIKPLPM